MSAKGATGRSIPRCINALLPVKRDGSPIELSRGLQKMKPNNVLINAALAAVVAAAVDQLQKDAQDPDIKKALDESVDLARKLDLKGTPLFLIGDRVIVGAPDDLFDQLNARGEFVLSTGSTE